MSLVFGSEIDAKRQIFHEEVEIKDVESDESTDTCYFRCPCGNKIVTEVSGRWLQSPPPPSTAFPRGLQGLHTGEKHYSCSICSKGSEQNQLWLHMRVHRGENPFSCSIYNASFSHRHILSPHNYIHSGEKPFSWSLYTKEFPQNSASTLHSKVDFCESPFTSSVRKANFIHRCNLSISHSNDLVLNKLWHVSFCRRFAAKNWTVTITVGLCWTGQKIVWKSVQPVGETWRCALPRCVH